MRQDRTAIDIYFVRNGDIVTQNSDIFQTSPLAYGAVPTDNGRLDPGVILDLAVLQEYTTLQTRAIANDNVWPDGHVGTNTAVVADFGGWVYHDIAPKHIRLGVRGQQLGVALCERSEV